MSEGSHLAQLSSGPIFIVGAARSGTTWVYDILTSHPLVGGAYETWLFTPQNGLASLFTGAHWPANRSGLGRLLSREELIEEVREFGGRLLARALKPGQHFLVEKSPSHIFAIDLIQEVFPEARIVHVLRDGRDVCVSVRAAVRSWVPQWARTFGRSIYNSARAWKHAVRRARTLGGSLGDRFLEVRFEQIKADPFGTYRQLYDFCRIPYAEADLQKVFERTDFDWNYRSKETAFRRAGRVGDWRTHFNLLDALMFNLAAGDALVETGYARNRLWYASLRRKVPLAHAAREVNPPSS